MTKAALGLCLGMVLAAQAGVAWAGADDEEEEPVSSRWEWGTFTKMGGGRWLLASARHPKTKQYASFVWNPRTRRWTRTGALKIDRYDHEATLLADGRVLVTGGYHVLPPPANPDPDAWVDEEIGASAEVYDPKTGTWSDAGTMTEPRRGHTTTVLADGRVLLFAGDDVGTGGLSSAEVWDPATRTFTAAGDSGHPRIGHQAVRLKDGRVLIAGGSADLMADTTGDAWLWDPRTSSFQDIAPMNEARQGFELLALPDGGALAIGGRDVDGVDGEHCGCGRDSRDVRSSERWDPVRDRWSFVATPSSPSRPPPQPPRWRR